MNNDNFQHNINLVKSKVDTYNAHEGSLTKKYLDEVKSQTIQDLNEIKHNYENNGGIFGIVSGEAKKKKLKQVITETMDKFNKSTDEIGNEPEFVVNEQQYDVEEEQKTREEKKNWWYE